MKASPALALVLLACTAPEAKEPFPSSLWLSVEDPEGVEPSSPLRYAVVWATRGPGREGSFAVTDDGPLGISSRSVSVRLGLPDRAVLARVDPMESVVLTNLAWADAYRPRIVVYADQDGDSRFDPGVLGGSGADRVLAVDPLLGPSPTALLHLDRVLKTLTLAEAERFYERNGGRYSPFVWTQASSTGRVMSPAPSSLQLALRDSVVPEVDLGCRRQWLSGSLGSPLAGGDTSGTVDASLDATAICGAQITACRSADLATIEPPVLSVDETGDSRRLLQCRTNAVLEFLLVTELDVECKDCVCKTKNTSSLYVTTPTVKPVWWPCGDSTPYCSSGLPAYAFDFRCYEDLKDGGADEGGVREAGAAPDAALDGG